MTVQEEERAAGQAGSTASTKSSGTAYHRRMRREELVAGLRLTATGSPIAATLSRVPFVALIILLLAGGIVGVLWLNTMSDATGLRASKSRLAQMDLDTDIEAARRDIAALKDPARLDAQARALGLVPPAGDAAMIVIDKQGKGTVVGTPTPVAGPPQTAPAATAATVAATTAQPTPVPGKTTLAGPTQAPPTQAVPTHPRSTAAPKPIPTQAGPTHLTGTAAPKPIPTTSATTGARR